jgi:WD40 repeat protein
VTAVTKSPDSQAAWRLRLPAYPISGLAGTSLKHEHLAATLSGGRQDGFFEVHAENYMGAGGAPHHSSNASAATIRFRCTACACRSAVRSLSIEPIWNAYVRSLNVTSRRCSEHLAWSTHETYFNDLLPWPYTVATLFRVSDHIDEVQQAIGRPILLENPSTYVVSRESTMSETDFIRDLARGTGCRLLLDVTVLRGHESWVNSAAFSPDGARIVTASWDTTARIWDATTGKEITVLRGHEGQRVSSNQSLRCRETEFSKQRQRGRNGFDGSTTPLQRQSLAKQLRQFGASRRERGNLC